MKLTEHGRVQGQRSRARSVGAIATLTTAEWEQTIADFNGLCAYCLEKPFTVLEHFLSIYIAGTCVTNCVPACFSCNQRKGDNTGEDLIAKFGEATIKRVQVYLASRAKLESILIEPFPLQTEDGIPLMSLRDVREKQKISPASLYYHIRTLSIETYKFPYCKRKYMSVDDFERIRTARMSPKNGHQVNMNFP